ncbi:DUF3939 domain-containing protein [Amphibacillus sp. Q70]|uniref:DUF3939 domain-containing protein n=1 Tax=Amphibacillus sp. Q70 TaxID=3453416 RepID=UPI003F829BC4
MWNPFKMIKKKPEYPITNVSMTELKQAIQKYTDDLPAGVPLSSLINEDLTIDYQKLAPYLKSIPIQTYYMSVETYDIFDEDQKTLAQDHDNIQKAVDQYFDLTGELPVIHGDPYFKVSYHKLMKKKLIDYRPHVEFFLNKKDHLITTKRPR